MKSVCLFATQIFLAASLPPSFAFFISPTSPRQGSCLHSSTDEGKKTETSSDDFLANFFESDCSDVNRPPSLNNILRSISQLASGSDIRGKFVDHARVGRVQSIGSKAQGPALTPFAAFCLGHAFATMMKQAHPDKDEVVICLGRDPRLHGTILADSFSRGAEGAKNVRAVYTGIATTPSMFEFCRYVPSMMNKCHNS
jgi:hypothetical protein